jgi:hypothetical protein
LEKYCPPLEGVNFELITHSGFRGRTKEIENQKLKIESG